LSSFYERLRENFEDLSRGLGALPSVPSEEDKRVLRKLERLKAADPFDSSYNVKGRVPLISGIAPERVVVEVREWRSVLLLTYWHFWPYDVFPPDHENWEPVTLVYETGELTRVDARVHNALISYRPEMEDAKPVVHFYRIGHTPVVKVRDRTKDVVLDVLNDGLDSTRRKWLDLCYQRAESDRWQPVSPPRLEQEGAPILDEVHWRAWGKHSIYLRI